MVPDPIRMIVTTRVISHPLPLIIINPPSPPLTINIAAGIEWNSVGGALFLRRGGGFILGGGTSSVTLLYSNLTM